MMPPRSVTLVFLSLCASVALAEYEEFYPDTAPYKVLEEKDGYEIRMYEPATWVSYKTKSMLIYKSEAITEAFMTLFRYISGENQEEKKIPMTTPVTNAIFPGHGPNCESNLTMSFYLSPEFQKDPPKPTEKGVYLEARPAMKVAVIRFGGFPSEEVYIQKSRELYTLLVRDGMDVKYDHFYTAGYSSEAQRKNRRQEIWDILEIM